MDAQDFKKDFLENVKSEAAVSGDGSCAQFTADMAENMMDAQVLPTFYPSFYKGKKGRSSYRVDGYAYDDVDDSIFLIITDYDQTSSDRRMLNAQVQHDLGELRTFLDAALNTLLYQDIEMSTPAADLVDMLRVRRGEIRKYHFWIFTDAEVSQTVKKVVTDDFDGVPVDAQVWSLDRLYRICASTEGRQIIEIDFNKYIPGGIPCLKTDANTEQYTSYLGVIPGKVLADIYDAYGSMLLEGNVRSFLSTKVAVNKKIRSTILKCPEMFFAFNNGISVVATEIHMEQRSTGLYLTYAKDFQIINGGQTTASISNARYKDKADISKIFVQMKLTSISESTPEETNNLIMQISRSSNSQNKVSDADFFANHPFHRAMEKISRRLYAPSVNGEQYETLWFYERARGQYLQEQMRLTPAQKKNYQQIHPKKHVIKKTDLAKVQNTWLGHPDVVSKGAQTNFNSFASYIQEQWEKNENQFNEKYYKSTVALTIIFQYLEADIPRQLWYEGGYRANIIYYTVALLHKLILEQFPGYDLDLLSIWNQQDLPGVLKTELIKIAKRVFDKITDPGRGQQNVTQWCKRKECWTSVQTIQYKLSPALVCCLISESDDKNEEKHARKDQKERNDIDVQAAVIKYPAGFWQRLDDFAVLHHLAAPSDIQALRIAEKIPRAVPNVKQSNKLLNLVERCVNEGFQLGRM